MGGQGRRRGRGRRAGMMDPFGRECRQTPDALRCQGDPRALAQLVGSLSQSVLVSCFSVDYTMDPLGGWDEWGMGGWDTTPLLLGPTTGGITQQGIKPMEESKMDESNLGQGTALQTQQGGQLAQQGPLQLPVLRCRGQTHNTSAERAFPRPVLLLNCFRVCLVVSFSQRGGGRQRLQGDGRGARIR